MFKNSTVIVFGGNGTIGREVIKQLILEKPKVIRIFTNDENGLFECEQKFGDVGFRYILGDIRDFRAVKMALADVDYVFNCAAIKHVSICEYNPMEAVSVNVLGLNNIIDACFKKRVKKLIHVSTDKAVEPSCVMGATKMIGEQLCASRQESKGSNNTLISCVRFGNVLDSRGSLVPKIQEQIRKGFTVTLTDERMKRYFIGKQDAGRFILDVCRDAKGGEIFIPKLEEIYIKDLINNVITQYAPLVNKDPKIIQIKIIGIQNGEKLREHLYSENEKIIEENERYIIK